MKFAGARNMVLNKQHKKDNLTLSEVSLKIEKEREKENNELIPRSYSYKKMALRRIPYFFWCLSLIFIFCGFLLLYNMLIEKKLFNTFTGISIWEYVVVSFIFVIGISIIVVAKYEKITLDKNGGEVVLSKFYLVKCKTKNLKIPFNSINSVYPVKINSANNTSNSVIYKIGIRFNQTETVVIFKSLFKYFMIKDVIKLRSYIFGRKNTYDGVEAELKNNISNLLNN